MVAKTSDRIATHVLLRAPHSRVWRASTTPAESGVWLGVRLQGAFRAGVVLSRRLTLNGFHHLPLDLENAAIEPEHVAS